MAKADWRALTKINAPVFGAEGFTLVKRDHWKTLKAIQSGLPQVTAAPWQKNSQHLRDFFRLDDDRQCFAASRYEWTAFYEPQITRGLVHFLDVAPTRLRKARCLAFARAVSASCKPEHAKSFDDDALQVRVVAEEKRVDILVELSDESGRFGVAVEAKFNHRLTKNQLESAVGHARDRRWDLDRSCFLVVGPHLDRLDCKILNKNASWSSVTWWALLRYLERKLPSEADCAEFRRFRATVWSQSYV